jgi:hypothetical protein
VETAGVCAYQVFCSSLLIFRVTIAGCGGYADDNVGAVSTTGHGESIMKYCLAHNILLFMEQGRMFIFGE